MLKNEAVQTMSLNIKFSYLAKNSKFSRSNSYFSILTPTFLRDGFLNSYFQNPSENSVQLFVLKILSRNEFKIMESQTRGKQYTPTSHTSDAAEVFDLITALCA